MQHKNNLNFKSSKPPSVKSQHPQQNSNRKKQKLQKKETIESMENINVNFDNSTVCQSVAPYYNKIPGSVPQSFSLQSINNLGRCESQQFKPLIKDLKYKPFPVVPILPLNTMGLSLMPSSVTSNVMIPEESAGSQLICVQEEDDSAAVHPESDNSNVAATQSQNVRPHAELSQSD